MRVFVYGTLKAGKANHHILEGAKFLGEDKAPGLLYTGHHYPMAVPANHDNYTAWISGEVYEVDNKILQKLDYLEGHPMFYQRVWVELQSGKRATIYYYQHPVQRLTPLPEGVWN